jgi:Na+-translocating ferredoxin:NAD+ oxidoreductase RnfG subunit
MALAGCAATPQAVTDTRDLGVAQAVFPGATALRDMAVPPGTPPVGEADEMIVKMIGHHGDCLGYWVEATVAARSGPFRIRILVDSNLTVKQTQVVSYSWERGRDVRKPDFTRQFEGKGPDSPLQIGEDIDAMTGATLSSRAMTRGVRDTISMLGTIQ